MSRFEIFVAVHEIADLAFDFWTESFLLKDYEENIVNPMRNVTKRGIFLKVFDFRPKCLHTPWGKWSPWRWRRSVFNGKPLNKFKRKMKLDIDARYSDGLIYKVLQVGNIKLPSPKYALDSKSCCPEKLVEEWNELKTKYGVATK